MKLLKSFLIFALICSIYAKKEVQISENIQNIEDLNEIDFEEVDELVGFKVTIDENDPNIMKSTEIYDKVTSEIEGINEDSEVTHDKLNDLREESSGSKWSSALAGALDGLFSTIFVTAANAVDTSVNKAVDIFNHEISSCLNKTDRIHTQKKLLMAKIQKCAEQKGVSQEEISEEVYEKIEKCIPEAVEQINNTALTFAKELRKVRQFMVEIPDSVNACLEIIRKATFMSSLGASAKTIYCLGGVTAQVGTDAAKLGTGITACGLKAGLKFQVIQADLQKCYLEGLAAVTKEAADRGYSIADCVVKDKKPE